MHDAFNTRMGRTWLIGTLTAASICLAAHRSSASVYVIWLAAAEQEAEAISSGVTAFSVSPLPTRDLLPWQEPEMCYCPELLPMTSVERFRLLQEFADRRASEDKVDLAKAARSFARTLGIESSMLTAWINENNWSHVVDCSKVAVDTTRETIAQARKQVEDFVEEGYSLYESGGDTALWPETDEPSVSTTDTANVDGYKGYDYSYAEDYDYNYGYEDAYDEAEYESEFAYEYDGYRYDENAYDEVDGVQEASTPTEPPAINNEVETNSTAVDDANRVDDENDYSYDSYDYGYEYPYDDDYNYGYEYEEEGYDDDYESQYAPIDPAGEGESANESTAPAGTSRQLLIRPVLLETAEWLGGIGTALTRLSAEIEAAADLASPETAQHATSSNSSSF